MQYGRYNSFRCSAAAHEYCLCATDAQSPPPPPAKGDEREFMYASVRSPGYQDLEGHATAFYKVVGNDIVLPANFQSATTQYDCPGEDTGAYTCARFCSEEEKVGLVAFSVTGVVAPPPPPSPPSPLSPPPPPPPPVSPWSIPFHGSTDLCYASRAYTGTECRDGGRGSIWPPLCAYGSQFTNCGPREEMRNGDLIANDACAHARNGECQDGGVGSVQVQGLQGCR